MINRQMRFRDKLIRMVQVETLEIKGGEVNPDVREKLEPQAILESLESLAILDPQDLSLKFNPFWNKFNRPEKKDLHPIHSRTCKLKLDL